MSDRITPCRWLIAFEINEPHLRTERQVMLSDCDAWPTQLTGSTQTVHIRSALDTRCSQVHGQVRGSSNVPGLTRSPVAADKRDWSGLEKPNIGRDEIMGTQRLINDKKDASTCRGAEVNTEYLCPRWLHSAVWRRLDRSCKHARTGSHAEARWRRRVRKVTELHTAYAHLLDAR